MSLDRTQRGEERRIIITDLKYRPCVCVWVDPEIPESPSSLEISVEVWIN